MYKSTSIFTLLVAILVSSNYCYRIQLPALNKQTILAKQYESDPPPAQSSVQFKLKGYVNMQEQNMQGDAILNNGATYGSWDLELYEYPLMKGHLTVKSSGKRYQLLAKLPNQNDQDVQGTIYNDEALVIGIFLLYPLTSNNINGQGETDPDYPEPLVRLDVRKSDLKGDYYYQIYTQKHKIGKVEVSKVRENYYQGEIKQSPQCKDTFHYQSEEGAGVEQFFIRKPFQCDLSDDGSTLLARMGEDDNAWYTAAYLFDETDQVWTYGEELIDYNPE